MERNKPAIRGMEEGEGERDRENGDVREEVNEIGNEKTREWIR